MADLGTYFGLGYRLDITTQLGTTYAEARTTFSLGNQTSLGTAGVVTASGVAQFYAITNPTGSVLVEAGPLKTGQPVVVDFSFTVEDFSSGNPKIIPQGHDGQGASMRIRGKRSKKDKEEFAGPKLNKAIEEALAPPPAPEPEPVIEVAVEAPSLPPPETPEPPAQVEVVSEPVTITYTPPSSDVLESGRTLAQQRAELVEQFLERALKRPVEVPQEPQVEQVGDAIKVTFYDPIQDEQDALIALNKVLREMGEDEVELAA